MIKIEPSDMEAVQESLTKRDLLEIVEELSIPDVDLTERYSKIVERIVQDCDKNGVPEWQDCSKLLRKFLMTAKITDADGELVGTVSPEVSTDDVGDVAEMPECFGFADLKDPACSRCKVVNECLKKHSESLPPCYGKSYSETAPECIICIERGTCREAKIS